MFCISSCLVVKILGNKNLSSLAMNNITSALTPCHKFLTKHLSLYRTTLLDNNVVQKFPIVSLMHGLIWLDRQIKLVHILYIYISYCRLLGVSEEIETIEVKIYSFKCNITLVYWEVKYILYVRNSYIIKFYFILQVIISMLSADNSLT